MKEKHTKKIIIIEIIKPRLLLDHFNLVLCSIISLNYWGSFLRKMQFVGFETIRDNEVK